MIWVRIELKKGICSMMLLNYENIKQKKLCASQGKETVLQEATCNFKFIQWMVCDEEIL